MRIFYPYHERLPLKTAHDVYVMHNCAGLADAGADLELGIDAGSWEDAELFQYYGLGRGLKTQRFFSLRKSGPFKLSWTLPFFYGCQRFIRRSKPDFVICSVSKQGAYHFSRRIPGVRYAYEVHQLARYPNGHGASQQAFERERAMLAAADLVVVTTQALKEVLQQAPYSLSVPIEVLPLGTSAELLPPKAWAKEPCLMYVGQLYQGQGVELLLEAFTKTEGVRLEIVGGSAKDLQRLKTLARELQVYERVNFYGFLPPAQLPALVQKADAFVAPFLNEGRMPYVAHTKLYEYAAWGRPVIAPDMPVVAEHFPQAGQQIAYVPDHVDSLAKAIQKLPEQAPLSEQAGPLVTWRGRGERYLQFLRQIVNR